MWTLFCDGGGSSYDTLAEAQEAMLAAAFRPLRGNVSIGLTRSQLADYKRRGVEHFSTRLAGGRVSLAGGLRVFDRHVAKKPVVMTPFQEVCLFNDYDALASKATIWEMAAAAKSGEVD